MVNADLGKSGDPGRATHKKVALDEVLSDFYVAEELAGTYRSMMIALPETEWTHLAELSDQDFVAWLMGVAKRVLLDRYPKTPRGPKKPRSRRMRYAKAKHITTARLMADAKNNEGQVGEMNRLAASHTIAVLSDDPVTTCLLSLLNPSFLVRDACLLDTCEFPRLWPRRCPYCHRPS